MYRKIFLSFKVHQRLCSQQWKVSCFSEHLWVHDRPDAAECLLRSQQNCNTQTKNYRREKQVNVWVKKVNYGMVEYKASCFTFDFIFTMKGKWLPDHNFSHKEQSHSFGISVHNSMVHGWTPASLWAANHSSSFHHSADWKEYLIVSIRAFPELHQVSTVWFFRKASHKNKLGIELRLFQLRSQ